MQATSFGVVANFQSVVQFAPNKSIQRTALDAPPLMQALAGATTEQSNTLTKFLDDN